MDGLSRSERRSSSVADRSGQLRCIGGADDRILSVYRAIMLSLAENACPIYARLRKVACIPSEIPSFDGVCSETSIDGCEWKRVAVASVLTWACEFGSTDARA